MTRLLVQLRHWYLSRFLPLWRRLWRSPPRAIGRSPPPPRLPLERYVSVVIPALNEAARIADVVRYALTDPATAEVIVVDDSSIDATAQLAKEAGARVITSSMLGKGASMRDGLEESSRDLITFLDGDLSGLRSGIISDLCRPLLRGEADLVKASFGRSGGRVTELTAKPMLKVFFAELAHFAQPLGGIVAARRSLLKSLEFEDGFGVDIGLLIDAQRAGARLAEIDIGRLDHDSQSLHDLAAMANEVARVIYARARAAGRLNVDQIAAMFETQRQAIAAIDYVFGRRGDRRHLLLLDMDGTVTTGRFAVELARTTGCESQLLALLDDETEPQLASERIAALFRFVHRSQFERVARAMEIRADVVACVNRMRRAGFMVGLVSDSFFVGAEIIRRRIFADFALAHTLQFEHDICTGELRLNAAFSAAGVDQDMTFGKEQVVKRFRADRTAPRLEQIWAIGDNVNDLEMLRLADRAFIIEPKTPALGALPQVTRIASFMELLDHLPNAESVA